MADMGTTYRNYFSKTFVKNGSFNFKLSFNNSYGSCNGSIGVGQCLVGLSELLLTCIGDVA